MKYWTAHDTMLGARYVQAAPSIHLCSQCKTPTGKSTIVCRNEPKEES